MDRHRFDFSPLDPTTDSVGWLRLVYQIMDAAAPELRRRERMRRSVLATIGGWTRPALVAAALAGVAAVGVWNIALTNGSAPAPLARADGGESATATGIAAPADSSEALPEWTLGGPAPSAAELLAVVEGGPR